MNITGKCPKCKRSWSGKKIPKNEQKLYGYKYFSKIISKYDYRTDRAVALMCPFCGAEWER